MHHINGYSLMSKKNKLDQNMAIFKLGEKTAFKQLWDNVSNTFWLTSYVTLNKINQTVSKWMKLENSQISSENITVCSIQMDELTIKLVSNMVKIVWHFKIVKFFHFYEESITLEQKTEYT